MKKVQPRSGESWKRLLFEPIKLGVIVGLYLWVAGAPFGFVHPDNENWMFFWRLLPFWRLLALVAVSVVGAAAVLLAFIFLCRRRERGEPDWRLEIADCGIRNPRVEEEEERANSASLRLCVKSEKNAKRKGAETQRSRKSEIRNGNDETLRCFRRAVSPVYFLLLGPVQLIPGAVAVLPVLPLVNKLILPVGVFSSTLFLFVIETRLLSQTVFRNFHRSMSSHRWRWSLALFLVSFLAYGVFMKRCNMIYGYTGGDEAHYLIQAQSLAEDFDRDLVNQMPDYTRSEDYYRAKHFSPKSAPGKAYSQHSIGLPLLMAPGWSVGKVTGALGVLVAISSLFAVTFFWIALKLLPRAELAIGSWAVFCFTTPIIFYACRAYPMVASGLVILFVVWRMMKPELLTGWGWLALGCLLGFLPWLHIPRLAIPTFLVSVWGIVWLLFHGRRKHPHCRLQIAECGIGNSGCEIRNPKSEIRNGNLAFFVAPLFVSAVLLVLLNQHWYGYSWGQTPGTTGFEKLDLKAWTGGYYQDPGELFTCLPGLLGTIVDRFRGLLVCSPAYLVPLLCVLLGLFSRKLKFWRDLWLWVFLAGYIPYLSRPAWFGGACFPSRPLVPVLPLLLFPFAGALSASRDRLLKAFFAVLAAFSGWITLRMLINPDHFYVGAENARWFSPATQLIALFYPYAGTSRPLSHIEDTFGIALFVVWVAGVIYLLQRARRKEMSWRRSFNMTVAAILALPLFTTAVRRAFNYQPYQFSFSGSLEHYSTLIGINRARRAAKLHVARWGEIPPETLTKELTLELPAVEEKSRTGEVENDESLNQKVVTFQPGKHEPGFLSYTRPLKIHRGDYRVHFWLAADTWNPGNSVVLDVQDMVTGKVIASHRLTSSDFGFRISDFGFAIPESAICTPHSPSDLPNAEELVAFPLIFSLPRYSKLSFRIYVDAKSPVRVLKYSVEPLCLPELLAAIKRPGENPVP